MDLHITAIGTADPDISIIGRTAGIVIGKAEQYLWSDRYFVRPANRPKITMTELHPAQGELIGVLTLAAVERLGGAALLVDADHRLRKLQMVRVNDIASSRAMDARKRANAGNPRTRLPLLCLVLAGEGSSVLLLVAEFDRAGRG